MSPEEVELLQHAGKVIIFNVSTLVAESILYGLYLVVFAFGLRALLKRSPWTQRTLILFAFLFILFLMSTLNLATTVAFTIGLIRGALVINADQSLIDRLRLADDNVKWLEMVGIWLGDSGGGFLFVFADAVVVWRACVLWPGNKIAKAFPLALLLASFGFAIVSATLGSIDFTASGVVSASSLTGTMLALSLSLSATTNVVATTLIGYKAYYHRKLMKKASVGTHSSRSGEILLFLTESGIAFCVLQAIALAINAADNNPLTTLDYAARVGQDITFFAAAAYPVLVLIIVESHRSISDYTGSSLAGYSVGQDSHADSLGSVESHITFAAPPAPPPGTSSTRSGGFGVLGSLTGPRIDPSANADHTNEDLSNFGIWRRATGLPPAHPLMDIAEGGV